MYPMAHLLGEIIPLHKRLSISLVAPSNKPIVKKIAVAPRDVFVLRGTKNKLKTVVAGTDSPVSNKRQKAGRNGGAKSKKRKRKSNKTRKRRRKPSKQKKHKKSKKPKTKRNPKKRKTKRK